MNLSMTNIKGIGYWQANQATVQRISGNNSKQSREKHHQVSQELQTDSQPSVKKHAYKYMHIHTQFKCIIIYQQTEKPIKRKGVCAAMHRLLLKLL